MKKLDRELGLFSVCSIACGAMLSGLFVLPGHAAVIGGPSVYLAFMLAGLLFLPASLSKAEMATALPESGGAYIFIDRALGPTISTIAGMGTWLALMLKSAFALVGVSAYLFLLIDLPPQYLKFFACGIGLFLIGLNCFGVKKTGQLQTVLVLISLLTLVIFVERGAIEVNREYYRPLFSTGWVGFLQATAFVFLSYAGVTKVVSVAEEIEYPNTNIPWGILLSLTVMTFFYTAVVFVTVGVIPMEEMAKGIYKNAPIAQAAKQFAGTAGTSIISVIAMLALTSMANAGLLASSRYPLAMSRYNQLPSLFGEIHSDFNTPIYAVLLTGGSILVSIIFLPVIQLAKLGSAFLLLVFTLINVAVIIFREGEIEWYRPEFHCPFYPYVQLIGIVSSLILIGFMGWITIVGSLALLTLGFLWHIFYARSRVDRIGVLNRPEARDEDALSYELDFLSPASNTDTSGKVIVPFFELKSEDLIYAERRIQLGASLCEQDEHLVVVHFEEVPEQSLLTEHETNNQVNEQLEERVRLIRHDLNVEVSFEVVLTHHSRAALRNYAQKQQPRWVVNRWKTPSRWKFLLGQNKWWLEDFPTNLVFFRDERMINYKDILVFTEPGPYDGEVVGAAQLIAEHHDGKITFLNPVLDSDQAREFVEDYHDSLEDLCDVPTGREVYPVDEWVEAVIHRTRQADLLIIGGHKERRFSELPTGQSGKKIADSAKCSLVRIQSNMTAPRTVLDTDLEKRRKPVDFLTEDRIELGTKLSSKEEAFERLASLLCEPEQNQKEILTALWNRENQQHTYVDNGVAFPHGIPEQFPETRLAILIPENPVEYTAEGHEARVIVATIGPPGDRRKHLDLLADIAKVIVSEEAVSSLASCQMESEVIQALKN